MNAAARRTLQRIDALVEAYPALRSPSARRRLALCLADLDVAERADAPLGEPTSDDDGRAVRPIEHGKKRGV